MSTSPTRIYSLRDDKVTIQGGVIKDHYIKYSSGFVDFNDVMFHPDYVNELTRRISNAENTLSDAFILKTQALASAQVDEVTEELVDCLDKIKFTVNFCFSKEKQIIEEFRFSMISELSRNADKFIGYCKDVLVMVEKYKEQLLANGLKQKYIDETVEQIEQLDIKRREQIETIQSRPIHTKERIETMNELWRMLVDIRNAANIAYADQPEIKALFQLPKKSRNNSEEELPEDSSDDNIEE